MSAPLAHAHEALSFRAEITLPPSSNNAYVNVPGRGRVPSAQHRDWKTAAGWEVLGAHPPKFTGPYRFTLFVNDKMRGDVDGRVKLPMDLLVNLRVTLDDRNAVSVHAERHPDVPVGRCIIVVEGA